MIFESLEERYHDADFWTGKIQLELFRLIREHLDVTGLSQNKFAEQLGVSKGYMSQVLNGDFDHRLSKLVSLALAVGKVPKIDYIDIDNVIQHAHGVYGPLHKSFVAQPQQIVVERTPPPTHGIHNSTPDRPITFKDAA
ncbi:MAG: helix-turn-helix transcriptional regulator [Lewinella sp.]